MRYREDRNLRRKHVAMKVSCAMTATATVQSITSKKLLHIIRLNVKSRLSNIFAIAEEKKILLLINIISNIKLNYEKLPIKYIYRAL